MKTIISLVVLFTMSVTAYSQKAKANSAQNKSNTILATKNYTCPMHPDVKSDKPGKCSKCGMDLLLSKKEQLKKEVTKNYNCPMHLDVTSNKAGKCPKCGMELKVVKSKTAANKG